MSGEDAAFERLKAKCKQCPGCGMGAYIDDKSACNHMRCVKCRHEWCWMCLKPWKGHGGSYYACNNYKKLSTDSGAKRAAREREAKVADLERFAHFDERFTRMKMGSSGNGAKALRRSTQGRMQRLVARGRFPLSEVAFLEEAAETVVDVRRQLKWACAFLYFRPDDEEDAELQLFKEQAGALEKHVDDLLERIMPDGRGGGEQKRLLTLLKRFEDPGDGEARNLFVNEWRKEVRQRTKIVRQYATRVMAAARKGSTIADPVLRERNRERRAANALKYVDWKFESTGGWRTFGKEVALALELAKMRDRTVAECARVPAFSRGAASGGRSSHAPPAPVRFDLTAMLAGPGRRGGGWFKGESKGAEAKAARSGFALSSLFSGKARVKTADGEPVFDGSGRVRILREVRARGPASKGWTCRRCTYYNADAKSNACNGCGTVKNH
jgi:hypothetical protein